MADFNLVPQGTVYVIKYLPAQSSAIEYSIPQWWLTFLCLCVCVLDKELQYFKRGPTNLLWTWGGGGGGGGLYTVP